MVFIFSERPFISFQGEGKSQGKLSLFLRSSGCQLKCGYCDSKFSWKNRFEITEEELFDYIKKVDNIIFTGGEPLLHIDVIKYIIVKSRYKTFEIETNGVKNLSIQDIEFFNKYKVQFNISPKISGYDYINKFTLLNQLGDLNDYIIKFLFDKPLDLADILIYSYSYGIPSKNIYLQPKATSFRKIKKLIIKYKDFFIKNKFNLSSRLHVILWGKKKGI